MFSKLIKILLIISSIILLLKCSSDDKDVRSVIPPISFSIQISLQSNPRLQIIGNSVYFSHYQGTNLGYRNHGIYVIKTGDSQYRSFDASCTYDPDTNEHIAISGTGYKCPTCNSQFELFTGSVVKEPANIALREYSTNLSETHVRVYN